MDWCLSGNNNDMQKAGKIIYYITIAEMLLSIIFGITSFFDNSLELGALVLGFLAFLGFIYLLLLNLLTSYFLKKGFQEGNLVGLILLHILPFVVFML
jgi:hypothetical protein